MERAAFNGPEEWSASLNATCNRLNTQYLALLRSASSVTALEEVGDRQDPRAGGGRMKTMQEPPAPLAADTASSQLQTKLAVQNICISANNLLDLIRTLRLSILLMDEDTVAAEEAYQALESKIITEKAQEEAAKIEAELFKLRNDV
mmetsp:Transcript_4671/g.5619  ORF Transcript_4671/g.5619 Transcript_4671/m.5619 type:complete len:147 (+) Transcript_4671:51-491(+)|eukprot:CAMPEP_0195251036 /NCGR_PEP_ID=MMETSP0706-20130129/3047_1 /TAXON_ID=33640 /ORGANISM="Asterionellopsis glacialis, Strain CCMP134" /LENGTH=146 /DNA_ID=CAMNT_0040303103 /DNA_START=138 /DNA_END=578 /DNA_ORIENTATION=+